MHDALFALQCTVVEVAHRLDAIDRFDEVVVMESGRVAEQGRTLELLHEPSSRLARLVASAAEAGREEEGGFEGVF